MGELTAVVQKRYGFPENSVELFAERRACYGVMRFVMENGAKGVEVIISGKLRAQRAKAMKFRDGYLISTGDPKNHYIESAVRHVAMRQGMLGIMVKIMLAHDPEGRMGPSIPLPDNIVVHEPKEEVPLMQQEYTVEQGNGEQYEG